MIAFLLLCGNDTHLLFGWTPIHLIYYKKNAREHDDERHIAPLQLDAIRRVLELWTNLGDTVFDPFPGVGSTGFEAVKFERKFIGLELKKSYFEQAVKNLIHADNEHIV